MPEFTLDLGSGQAGPHLWCDLDSFTQGYIEAMFFTDASDSDDGDLADGAFDQLAPETIAAVIVDCDKFQKENADHLLQFEQITGRPLDHAGHDFWLTRNGHGAGFWDRGAGTVGDTLTGACKHYRSCNLYRGDDDLIYLV